MKVRRVKKRTAQDPERALKLKLQPAGEEFAPTPEEEPGLIDPKWQKYLEEKQQQEAPPPSDVPESAEDEIKKIQNQLLQQNFDDAVVDLWNDTEKLLTKHKVQNYGVAKDGMFVEQDGVDLVINVGTANIPGATLLFDYNTGWTESLLRVLEQPGTLFTKTSIDLNEVIFEVCGLAYAALGREQIGLLLDAVATLQIVDTRPENAADRPEHIEFKGEESRAEAIDWALGVVLKPMLEYNPDGLYQDKNVALQDAQKVAQEDGWLSKEQVADFEAILSQVDNEEWSTLVEQYRKAIVGRQFRPSKAMVEDAVAQLTDNKYQGDYLINYSSDGHLEVTLEAPYPFAFSFERSPNALRFYRAGMVGLCDKLFETRDINMATDLVFADVYLGQFYEQAANPGASQERSKGLSTEEDVVEEYSKRLLKQLKREPEKQREEGWKELAALVDDKPQEFVDYVVRHKERMRDFFKDNIGFMQYLQTDRPQIWKGITEALPMFQIEPTIE